MPEGALLGLDYGRKRIGIAVATALGTVHPRPRLDRGGNRERDLQAIRKLVEETEAMAIVIGLPHHMDGTVSEMEREARGFAAELGRCCGVPIYGMDERLTSEAADTVLKNRNLDGRARKRRIDSAAACIVLQDFLQIEEPQRELIA